MATIPMTGGSLIPSHFHLVEPLLRDEPVQWSKSEPIGGDAVVSWALLDPHRPVVGDGHWYCRKVENRWILVDPRGGITRWGSFDVMHAWCIGGHLAVQKLFSTVLRSLLQPPTNVTKSDN